VVVDNYTVPIAFQMRGIERTSETIVKQYIVIRTAQRETLTCLKSKGASS
jgi:hypothetical protein